MARTAVQRALIRKVWRYYERAGRHDLPWRKTRDPYRILVSEVMLQQTQVERVRGAYVAFIKKFPTLNVLARAPLADVLIAWQGLGYNRRAKALHDTARAVVTQFDGTLPRTEEELRALPGIGPYTAGAVCAFAYNNPTVIIETNIRTVLLHELLPNRVQVPDGELYELTSSILDGSRPREWYWALMDYGAYLKQQGVRVNTFSRHYTKQAPFKGSLREARGAILKHMAKKGAHTTRSLERSVSLSPERARRSLEGLARDGLVTKKGARWHLA